jgi:hypothetical protein
MGNEKGEGCGCGGGCGKRFDDLEKALAKSTQRMSDLEERFSYVEKRLTTVEKGCKSEMS